MFLIKRPIFIYHLSVSKRWCFTENFSYNYSVNKPFVFEQGPLIITYTRLDVPYTRLAFKVLNECVPE